MKGTEDTKANLPELKNDGRMYVYLQGNHFKKNSPVIPNISKVVSIGIINIYVVYKLDPISSTRNTDYIIQNALFGAMKIIVIMSSSIHATNRANNIYVMGKDFIQGINDTTIYAEKLFHNNFIEFGVKFVLSLHYNGDNSYLFANGRQELKFKAKDDQIISERLCLGNLSSEWTRFR